MITVISMESNYFVNMTANGLFTAKGIFSRGAWMSVVAIAIPHYGDSSKAGAPLCGILGITLYRCTHVFIKNALTTIIQTNHLQLYVQNKSYPII